MISGLLSDHPIFDDRKITWFGLCLVRRKILCYFGAMRMPPSIRTVSPFMYELVMRK